MKKLVRINAVGIITLRTLYVVSAHTCCREICTGAEIRIIIVWIFSDNMRVHEGTCTVFLCIHNMLSKSRTAIFIIIFSVCGHCAGSCCARSYTRVPRDRRGDFPGFFILYIIRYLDSMLLRIRV